MDEKFLKLFPQKIINLIEKYVCDKSIQEIRVRVCRPLIFTTNNGEIVSDLVISKEDINFILQRISNYSLYAYEEEIKQGFITIKGGHRVGIAGECVMDGGQIKTIKNISSLNIRICREVIGCSNKLMKYISESGRVYNTLIISPPKCGKTTLLRDISRNLSKEKIKISIVDERSEIAACFQGIPQMNIGIRSDVLDNCLKSEGMILAIRSLSPDVIICDEIGTKKDVEALIKAFNSGVNLITTIHGYSIEDISRREVFHDLFVDAILQRIIVLSNRNGVGTVEGIYEVVQGEDKKCLRLF